jgi:hypothetical protein
VVKESQDATDMKSADEHLESGVSETPRQIHRTGVLIGLHADQTNKRFPTGTAATLNDLGHLNFLHSFIEELDGDLEVVTESPSPFHIFTQGVEACQRIAGQHTMPVAQHVSVIVVL